MAYCKLYRLAKDISEKFYPVFRAGLLFSVPRPNIWKK